MKKLLCIIFSILISTSSIAYCSAQTVSLIDSTITADEFAAEITCMIEANSISQNLPLVEDSDDDEFSTGRLIVKSKRKINTYDAESVVCGYEDLWVLQFSSSARAREAFNYYSNISYVDYVEVDKEVHGIMTENNTDSDSSSDSVVYDKEYLSWGPEYIGIDGLNKNIVKINYDVSDVIVAVVDTGVDPDHPYLAGRILPSRINTSSSGIRNSSMDDNGHGTQVAGVIVDSTLDNVYVKPYKVLDSNGKGTLITLAAGINCAVNDNVDVINISIGFLEKSDILKSALNNAEINDILVISSAGNDGNDTLYYPASYDNVVKVTSVNSSGLISYFSSYGNGVDFAAPGYKITTTTLNNKYHTANGTSLSSPFVSALAATIKGCSSKLKNTEILEIMASYAIIPNENNVELKYGNGILCSPQNPVNLESRERVETPYFSHKTAFSFTEIDVQIFCDTPGSVIYYTTDRTIPSKDNSSSKIYDGTPIHISETTSITAVAFCDDMFRSSYATFGTIIAPYEDESCFEINSDGVITEYNGKNKSLSLPLSVNGIKVKEIGANVFKDTEITEIILPDTVEKIGNNAFENCTSLKTIYSKNTTVIGDYAFSNCSRIKNMLLLAELSEIGKYSFENTGMLQYFSIGSSYTLNLLKLKKIPEGAFQNAAISSLELGNVSSIERNAFSSCELLVNVNIKRVSQLDSSCFMGCDSLAIAEISGLVTVPESCFRDCQLLTYASFPNAVNVNARAFLNCVSLVQINLPLAETVYSNAFFKCSSLKTLTLPSMKYFEASLYRETNTATPLLPENLEMFDAQNLEETVPDMFINCNKITYIRLNDVTEIAENTFRSCHNIYSLNIENVKEIQSGAFNDCSITFIDGRSIVSTKDLPDNSGILLSNNFLESSESAENLTIYGTSGTFVERYANAKGYNFVEIPLVYKPVPEFITENSETVHIIAVGFDLTYQWYWNTVPSTENANPIDGATMPSYTFTENDTAPYYFCKIKQNDLGTVSEITTSIISKDSVPADYTEYNKAVKAANSIDRSLYKNLAELDNALKIDVSDRYSCEQNFVDEQTSAIYNALNNLKIKKIESVTLYLPDTVMSVFDESRIIYILNPDDAIYKNIEWISSNEEVIVVFQNGYIICVGNGEAEVTLRVTNLDDSVTESSIRINGNLNFFEKFIASIFRAFFISVSRISNFFVKLFNINFT